MENEKEPEQLNDKPESLCVADILKALFEWLKVKLEEANLSESVKSDIKKTIDLHEDRAIRYHGFPFQAFPTKYSCGATTIAPSQL